MRWYATDLVDLVDLGTRRVPTPPEPSDQGVCHVSEGLARCVEIRVSNCSAARIGECLAIGWTDVDLDAATVDVCWRLGRRTGLRLSSTLR
jgi:integrase